MRLKTLLTALALAVPSLTLAPVAPAHAHPQAHPAVHAATIWKPGLNTRWQYQLQPATSGHTATGGVNVGICKPIYNSTTCVQPQVYDIDLYSYVDGTTPNAAAVQAIHAAGGKAICYVDAGDTEKFRPDYQQFVDWNNAHNKSLIGNPFTGYTDEFYLNINNDQGQRDFVLQMQEARVQKCVQAGFDGVEFDVVDVYTDNGQNGADNSGWNISYDTQLTFNRALADLAHRYNLSVALKNDTGQVPDLVSSFDYAVDEQCFESGATDCTNLSYFTNAGKPVFEVEYNTVAKTICPKANVLNYNAIKKGTNGNLADTPYTPCR